MRLLNIDTLELHEFFERNIPRYAILSHRWEKDEVTFEDVTSKQNLQAAGWRKIKNFCKFVGQIRPQKEERIGPFSSKQDSEQTRLFDWAWVDTCCIDKRSSAELSEAINSMYKWYQAADVCYVYLSDVSCEPEGARSHEDLLGVISRIYYNSTTPLVTYIEPGDFTWYQAGHIDEPKSFASSAWFQRSWTLQELIAPKRVLFIDREWKLFGSRHLMSDRLSVITGIEQVGMLNLSNSCVATKMSWAAKRNCTRSEDVAYSLLGLFDVNMPLLYGEGSAKAFERLQLEIIKVSDDESIFAWDLHKNVDYNSRYGILAGSPRDFRSSWKISTFRPKIPRPPYTMTNKGLQITANFLPAADYRETRRVFLPLCCFIQGQNMPLAMRLICIGPGEYVREARKSHHQTNRLPGGSMVARNEFGAYEDYIVGEKHNMWDYGSAFDDDASTHFETDVSDENEDDDNQYGLKRRRRVNERERERERERLSRKPPEDYYVPVAGALDKSYLGWPEDSELEAQKNVKALTIHIVGTSVAHKKAAKLNSPYQKDNSLERVKDVFEKLTINSHRA